MKTIKMILKAEAERKGDNHNHTRLYNIVNRVKGGEARIDTYAVKDSPSGFPTIKNVARYYTKTLSLVCKDILLHHYTNSFVVNWAEMPWGRKHQAVWVDVDAYQGYWSLKERVGERTCQPFLRAKYLNDLKGTRYEHCGYDVGKHSSYMHIIEYLQCWNISHSVEFLAKADLWKFITPSFVRELAESRESFQFFRSNFAEIKKGHSIGAIHRSMRTGESLEASSRFLHYTAVFSRLSIPKCVPRKDLIKYLCKHADADEYAYETYCHNLAYLGIDINTYGYMFPSNWTKKYDEVHDAWHAKFSAEQAVLTAKYERERKIREARERRERAARLARWKVISAYCNRLDGARMGRFELVMPKSAEDLKREGNLMHNCIGGYGARWADGETILCFLYKDGKPSVDIEISTEDFKVIQTRRKNNATASADERRIAREIADKIKKHTKRKAA